MILPGIMFFILFKYMPMVGLVVAFKDYNIFKGIFASEWVGFGNFRYIFSTPEFWRVLKNTIVISMLKILIAFPVPIVLSLLLNEMRKPFFKRLSQTLLYVPHFISWIIIGTIFLSLFSPEIGFYKWFLDIFGGKRVNILAIKQNFRPVIITTAIWKNSGWGTIIYLAAMSQIDPNLYEAAIVDGANKWKQIWHITIPSITGIIVLLLILRIGNILHAGFQQILVFLNPLVRDVGDIIDTYVFRVGIQQGQYSITAAYDFFKSLVALVLIVSADKFAKHIGEKGLL